jgi:prophage antirepressor-like protein
MENTPQVFTFDANTVIRTVVKNNEPFFVVKDVCTALDLIDVNKTISRLKDNYEAIQVDPKGVLSTHPLQTAGGMQEMLIITETGLYDLVMQSRKPSALKFKHWITSVVLPTIRKTGYYSIAIPKSLPEALRLYANELEMKELALKQRDEAIKTKAWISDKKTATAMATASVAVRENGKLKEQIGDSKTYKQVKAIPWLKDFFDLKAKAAYGQIGRQLSRMSESLGYERKDIEDSTWGKVKAYHVNVIDHFKCKLNEDLNMLRKYRRKA